MAYPLIFTSSLTKCNNPSSAPAIWNSNWNYLRNSHGNSEKKKNRRNSKVFSKVFSQLGISKFGKSSEKVHNCSEIPIAKYWNFRLEFFWKLEEKLSKIDIGIPMFGNWNFWTIMNFFRTWKFQFSTRNVKNLRKFYSFHHWLWLESWKF